MIGTNPMWAGIPSPAVLIPRQARIIQRLWVLLLEQMMQGHLLLVIIVLVPTYSTTANKQMMMHFAGGYVLYTGSGGQENFPSGIELQPNANA